MVIKIIVTDFSGKYVECNDWAEVWQGVKNLSTRGEYHWKVSGGVDYMDDEHGGGPRVHIATKSTLKYEGVELFLEGLVC